MRVILSEAVPLRIANSHPSSGPGWHERLLNRFGAGTPPLTATLHDPIAARRPGRNGRHVLRHDRMDGPEGVIGRLRLARLG